MENDEKAVAAMYEKAKQKLVDRFGGGRIAEKAAKEALRRRAGKKDDQARYRGMFQFTGPIPVGLPPDMPDLLEIETRGGQATPSTQVEISTASRNTCFHPDNCRRDGLMELDDPAFQEGECSSAVQRTTGNMKEQTQTPNTEARQPHIEENLAKELEAMDSSECSSLSAVHDREKKGDPESLAIGYGYDREIGAEGARDDSLCTQMDWDSQSESGATDCTLGGWTKQPKKTVDIGVHNIEFGDTDTMKSHCNKGDSSTKSLRDMYLKKECTEGGGIRFSCVDEAGADIGQIAAVLNGLEMDQASPSRSGRSRRQGKRVTSDSPGSQVYNMLSAIPRCESPTIKQGKSGSASLSAGGFVSRSASKVRRSNDYSNLFYRRFQVKKHHSSSPDFKFSQPRSSGPQATLHQVIWSFDEAHPALAEDHYLRSQEQNRMLQDERWKQTVRNKMRALRRERNDRKSVSRRSKRMGKGALKREGTKNGRCESAPPELCEDPKTPDGTRKDAGYAEKIKILQCSLKSMKMSQESDHSRTTDSGAESGQEGSSVPTAWNEKVESRAPPVKNRDGAGHSGSEVDDEDLSVGIGAFDCNRFKEFSEGLDSQMRRRAEEGYERGDVVAGYESDLEKEEEEARRLEEESSRQVSEEEVLRQQEEEMKETWAKQNEWMDVYRRRLGPDSGYSERKADAGFDESLEDDQNDSIDAGFGSLSVADIDIIKNKFIPCVSPKLGDLAAPKTASGYESEDGFSHKAIKAWRVMTHQPPEPTVPKPFGFEERAKKQAATIMEVKTQQDLEINRREKSAIRKQTFKANPIPKSTREPRFDMIMAGQETKRRLNQDQSVRVLQELEQPFSFYYRDKIKAEEKKKGKKDPNRFQRQFRAKEVPLHVREERYSLLLAEAEARKIRARNRAEALMDGSQMPPRMEAAAREYNHTPQPKHTGRPLHPADPEWGRRYTAPMRLGEMPNFDMLHRDWDDRLAKAKAANRQKLTTAEGFSFCSEQEGERHKMAEERRKQVLIDMCFDDDLPEQRWPFMSNRRKVHPTAPPEFVEPDLKVSDTRANRLRSRAIGRNKKKGKYASGQERALIEAQKVRKDSESRAKLYVQMQREKALQRYVAETAGQEFLRSEAEDKPTDTKPDAGTDKRHDTPHQHIQARHRQAEKQAREIVEDVLLEQGLDVYRYVEDDSP